jgi:predicted outer membrane protein
MNALFAIAVWVTTQNPLTDLKVPSMGGTQGDSDTLAKLVDHARDIAELGKLGKTQGGSTQVRGLGDLLVKDQSTIEGLVKGVSMLKGIDLSKPPQDAQKKQTFSDTLAKLKGLKGADFDQLFARTVKDEQDQQIADVRTQKSATKDPQVGSVLEKVLPYLQKHSAAAQQVLEGAGKPAS